MVNSEATDVRNVPLVGMGASRTTQSFSIPPGYTAVWAYRFPVLELLNGGPVYLALVRASRLRLYTRTTIGAAVSDLADPLALFRGAEPLLEEVQASNLEGLRSLRNQYELQCFGAENQEVYRLLRTIGSASAELGDSVDDWVVHGMDENFRSSSDTVAARFQPLLDTPSMERESIAEVPPPSLSATYGDIASMLLAGLGPMLRFGDGKVHDYMGLGLPQEMINPLEFAHPNAYTRLDGAEASAFYDRPDDEVVLYDTRDIAGEILRAIRN